MEEEKKVKVTEKEAKNKIIQRLRNRKIVCSLKNRMGEDISNENFDMEIRPTIQHAFYDRAKEDDYDKVNIQISTDSYPHTRRRLNDFDVINGVYSELVEKVNFIIAEDIKKKQIEQVKENSKQKNLEILKEKLQGLGARKEQYGDSYKIKNKYFEITFFAHEDRISIDIEEPADMTLDQAIELINKLK